VAHEAADSAISATKISLMDFPPQHPPPVEEWELVQYLRLTVQPKSDAKRRVG
jgi:hypothetical protein